LLQRQMPKLNQGHPLDTPNTLPPQEASVLLSASVLSAEASDRAGAGAAARTTYQPREGGPRAADWVAAIDLRASEPAGKNQRGSTQERDGSAQEPVACRVEESAADNESGSKAERPGTRTSGHLGYATGALIVILASGTGLARSSRQALRKTAGQLIRRFCSVPS
jgi:hypothetical protein